MPRDRRTGDIEADVDPAVAVDAAIEAAARSLADRARHDHLPTWLLRQAAYSRLRHDFAAAFEHALAAGWLDPATDRPTA